MKPQKHIDRFLNECRAVQKHGHCEGNPAAWSAVNDIEIAVDSLRRAFESKINNHKEKHGGK